MNTPLDRSLQILDNEGSVVWDADLVEDGDPADPEAAKYKDYIPTWHGLSAEGDVQGNLIYANYGRQEDYEELLAKGTNFTGKIVLTRYGGIFRGLKVNHIPLSVANWYSIVPRCRSKEHKNLVLSACSYILTLATMGRLLWITVMLHTPMVRLAIPLLSNAVRCNLSRYILASVRIRLVMNRN